MKNKKRSIVKKIICISIFLYIGFIFLQQQSYLNTCKKLEADYLKEIEKQKQIAEQLKNQKVLYKSDAFIEKIAREKLGMVFPGEKIFIDVSK